jgi:hypothetical protein
VKSAIGKHWHDPLTSRSDSAPSTITRETSRCHTILRQSSIADRDVQDPSTIASPAVPACLWLCPECTVRSAHGRRSQACRFPPGIDPMPQASSNPEPRPLHSYSLRTDREASTLARADPMGRQRPLASPRILSCLAAGASAFSSTVYGRSTSVTCERLRISTDLNPCKELWVPARLFMRSSFIHSPPHAHHLAFMHGMVRLRLESP